MAFYKVPIPLLRLLHEQGSSAYLKIEAGCIEHYRLALSFSEMELAKHRHIERCRGGSTSVNVKDKTLDYDDTYCEHLEKMKKSAKLRNATRADLSFKTTEIVFKHRYSKIFLEKNYYLVKDYFTSEKGVAVWGSIDSQLFKIFQSEIDKRIMEFCLLISINSWQGKKDYFYTSRAGLLYRALGFNTITALEGHGGSCWELYQKINRTGKSLQYFFEKHLQLLYQSGLVRGKTFCYNKTKRVLVLSTKIQSMELAGRVRRKKPEKLSEVARLARETTKRFPDFATLPERARGIFNKEGF